MYTIHVCKIHRDKLTIFFWSQILQDFSVAKANFDQPPNSLFSILVMTNILDLKVS